MVRFSHLRYILSDHVLEKENKSQVMEVESEESLTSQEAADPRKPLFQLFLLTYL